MVDEAETRIKKLKSKTHSRNFASNHRGDWVPIFCFSLVTAIETDVDIHFVEAIANEIKFFLNNLVGSGNESNDQWSFYIKLKPKDGGLKSLLLLVQSLVITDHHDPIKYEDIVIIH